MSLKRKVHKSKKVKVPSKGSISDIYNQFSKEFRETKTPMTFLREKYRAVFKSKLPDASPGLIKVKISYHLLVVEGYQKYNVPVPEIIMQNYKASQELNIERFDRNMNSMLKLDNIKNGKEDDMAKKKKVVKVVKVVKKATSASGAKKAEKKDMKPRGSISGLFAEIFAANGKAKLTDEKIAKEINAKGKAMSRGKEYCHKDIPAVRRKFNLGLLAGQTGKPKVELKKVEDKK